MNVRNKHDHKIIIIKFLHCGLLTKCTFISKYLEGTVLCHAFFQVLR